jgi:hypothetical protein
MWYTLKDFHPISLASQVCTMFYCSRYDVPQLFLPIILGLNLLLFKKKKEKYESFWKVYAHVEPIQINCKCGNHSQECYKEFSSN